MPVNGATAPNVGVLQTYLDSVYRQANVRFTVTEKTGFRFNIDSVGVAGLARAGSGINKYSAEMRMIRDKFAIDTTYDKKASYIFVVSAFEGGGLDGFMVRGRSMGFVASGASKRTYAHELGHGAFGLEHTFPEIGQSLSNNLMDYGDSTHLTHKQCKDIQRRKFVFNWADSEEDGSSKLCARCPVTGKEGEKFVDLPAFILETWTLEQIFDVTYRYHQKNTFGNYPSGWYLEKKYLDITKGIIASSAYFADILTLPARVSPVTPIYCDNNMHDFAKIFLKFHIQKDFSDDFYVFLYKNIKDVAKEYKVACSNGMITSTIDASIEAAINLFLGVLVNQEDKGRTIFTNAYNKARAFQDLYTSLKNDQQLKDHIFKGFTSKKLNSQRDTIYRVVGVHHKKAFTDKNSGFAEGDVKFKNYKTVAPASGQVPYKCKVKMYYPGLLSFPSQTPDEIGWKTSEDKSFFPDDWSEDKIFEEIAIAFQNKIFERTSINDETQHLTNIYKGNSSVGFEIQIIFDTVTNKIVSAYPNLRN